ncbi:hypothetical protein ABT255_33705 [Streptomyces mirabilis]|uniref:hypothetical protein n=1 Tax=Streptomyces mirabilis TaxID=68239 RepID=UPI0033229F40
MTSVIARRLAVTAMLAALAAAAGCKDDGRGDDPTGQPTPQPTTLLDFAAATDTGETSITGNGCENVELRPGENCQVTLSHTAEEPGRFSVTLTAMTSQGTTLTVPLSGEVVGASKPTTATTGVPTSEPASPTVTGTESTPTPDVTGTPSP